MFKIDKIEFLQRTTFVEHLLTNKKMYDFENDLSIIDMTRGLTNPGYSHTNGNIIAGNGWTQHGSAATRTPTPMPYMSQYQQCQMLTSDYHYVCSRVCH